MFNGKKRLQMGYTAKNIVTEKVYYSKGATKLAYKIGIAPSTLIRNASFNYSTKVYKGYVIAKTVDLENQNRGKNIK
jgi:hypothetical protein